MRILFIVPYPEGMAPSQRFRFEHYFNDFNSRNIQYDVSSFIDLETWEVLYQPGFFFRKMTGLLKGYMRRFKDLLRSRKYDYVFIHREFSPLGPPLMEWWLAKICRAKIIYDFDDAIWIPNYSEHNSFTFYLKRYSNTRNLCRWAYKVSCGNDYLCNYARLYNKQVVYNPTVIDTERHHNREASPTSGKFVIGWTGSHSTIQYLNEIFPVIKELEQDYDFEFRVISDVPPSFSLRSLKFIRWNKETEISDMLDFSVGIMPLRDDQWAQGKCGFKALQYMALGIPALVSPVGVNTRIVDHGINGFHCRNQAEWKEALVKCLTDQSLLQKLRRSTRQKVVNYYSVNSNRENFFSLFT
jgi:glycosyltransferase involved in cell wall biosynthesis